MTSLVDEVDDEDVAGAALQRGKGDAASVGRDVGRLRIIDRPHVDALLDLPGEDVLDDERSRLLGADEIGEAVAVGRP